MGVENVTNATLERMCPSNLTSFKLVLLQRRAEMSQLSPFHITDAEDVFAYAKDPEWAIYLGWGLPRPYRRRDAEKYVAGRILAPWSTNPTFAIELDSAVIGASA